MGGPFGLDMGATLLMGQAMGVDMALLADVLPSVEAAIIAAMDDEGEEEGD
jgi:hypothetical protein